MSGKKIRHEVWHINTVTPPHSTIQQPEIIKTICINIVQPNLFFLSSWQPEERKAKRNKEMEKQNIYLLHCQKIDKRWKKSQHRMDKNNVQCKHTHVHETHLSPRNRYTCVVRMFSMCIWNTFGFRSISINKHWKNLESFLFTYKNKCVQRILNNEWLFCKMKTMTERLTTDYWLLQSTYVKRGDKIGKIGTGNQKHPCPQPQPNPQ